MMKHVNRQPTDVASVNSMIFLSFLKLFILLLFFSCLTKTEKSVREPFQFGFVLNYSRIYYILKSEDGSELAI